MLGKIIWTVETKSIIQKTFLESVKGVRVVFRIFSMTDVWLMCWWIALKA